MKQQISLCKNYTDVNQAQLWAVFLLKKSSAYKLTNKQNLQVPVGSFEKQKLFEGKKTYGSLQYERGFQTFNLLLKTKSK